MAFRATRFDGRTASAQDVTVVADGDVLRIERGDAVVERVPLADAVVSPRLARAPRMIGLADGGTLEIDDDDGAFDRALRHAGIAPGPAQRLESHAAGLAAAILMLVVGVVWIYFIGLPLAARTIAERTPPAVEAEIGDELLSGADRAGVFQPSTLPAEKRDAIARRFAALAAKGAPAVRYKLEFRAMHGDAGINALTLPGGTIVMLDGMVDTATDAALDGVFAHELGHVANRHTLRGLLEASGVGILASALWGDISVVATQSALVLGTVAYSRDFEREADAFAVQVLAASGRSVEPMIQLLIELEKRRFDGDAEPAFMSTHPLTAERVQNMRTLLRQRRHH
jgi:predicted Zn-dependent protease